MSTYTSTLQKRKSNNNKIKETKLSQQQQNNEIKLKANNEKCKSSTAAAAAATTTSTTSPSSVAVAAALALANNERFQRKLFTDKLEEAIRHQQQLNLSNTPACNPGTLITCNGIVNCCRDVNCHLNSPNLMAPIREPRSVSSLSTASSVSFKSNSTKKLSPSPTPTCSSTTSASSSSSSSSTSLLSSARSSLSSTKSILKTGPTAKTKTQAVGAPQTWQSSLHRSAATTAEPASETAHQSFTVAFQLDLFSWLLFALAFATRFYKLAKPSNIVFDELHYGKYISLYLRNMFFFDQHPPLGKQLIAAAATFTGYDGNFTFSRIGAEYSPNVPIFALRFVPALCGSLLAPAVYKLLQQVGLNRWTSLLGGLLIIFDNALLTQSRFILMESMLLLFCTLGIYTLLSFLRSEFAGAKWFACGIATTVFLTCACSVKYSGFYTCCLAFYLMAIHFWNLVYDATITNFKIAMETIGRILVFTLIPLAVYVGVFYIHLQTLHRAGPHDSVMTSAFQASLDGGLASITRGQPLKVVHGSQITLRHTHGRTCWLHSHTHVYPVRYPDNRGSSHQQQVTCYSFKDVNNWWIVKRPDREDLVVGGEPDAIRHGDIIQLVHGITSRGLNSHDVAAPVTPQCQEVSCYIDYEINMSGELLWRVDILNRDTEGPIWHAIKSKVRLIHQSTGAALRFSGRQLPEWGFNQHEVVGDRSISHEDAIWNVEEHRYTKLAHDQRERERQLLNAEMIPIEKTRLSFIEKFIELQTKMLWNAKQVQSHMYSSDPLEWPLLTKGIAYWIDSKSNAQIHLLGNILIWYTGTASLIVYTALAIFYLLRRQRCIFDLPPNEWEQFVVAGNIFFVGYLIHYMPYFFMDRTLFLHHYLPAFLFKLLLLCFVVQHIDRLLQLFANGERRRWLLHGYRVLVVVWLALVAAVFIKFLPLCYGRPKLNAEDVIALRWKDTWDLILQKNYALN